MAKTKRKRSGASPTRAQKLKRWLFISGSVAAAGLSVVVAYLIYLSASLPNIESLEDYAPPQSTRIFSDDGQLVGELYTERRRVAPIEAIPKHVVYAFLAAEDSSFYEHKGLDYIGILRAAILNLRPGAHLQGASTITQQTVKTLVVGAERSYTRKMREALLAKQLEELLSKDDILYLYLNQIYFGGGAYGVEEAARLYFGKSVRDITLGEAAYLASIPKSPSKYTLRDDPKAAKARQIYVLNQMVDKGWAQPPEAKKEIDAPIPAPAPPPAYLGETPHYVEQVRRMLLDTYPQEQVYEGGLTVYVGMHAPSQVAAQKALRQGLQDLGRRHGWPGAKYRIEVDRFNDYHGALRERFAKNVERLKLARGNEKKTWVWDLKNVGEKALASRGALLSALEMVDLADDLHLTGVVVEVDNVSKDTFVDLGSVVARIPFKSLEWARQFSPLSATKKPHNPSEVLRKGDLVLVQLGGMPKGKRGEQPMVEAELVPRPMTEGAMVAIDPHTRLVRALVGGYEQRPGDLIRAVQAKRQPGSAFKPILYATALAEKVITPASMCPDAPVVIRDPWTGKSWKPENHDGEFHGNITYRQALTKSKNTCSVKLIDKVGYEPVIELARKLGIKSDLPQNLTLALGTGDVTPLELANAYATLAAGGLHAEPILIRKVVTLTGEVLQENRATLERVMEPAATYVVTQMMRSVVEEGTAKLAQVLDRVVVGKTGTSQQSRNVWFAGYSPELVATVYAGFDNNDPMGRAYGSSVALPIWVRFMSRALMGVPAREFEVPEDVVTVRVNKATGEPTSSTSDEDSLEEVFIAGTEPEEKKAPLVNPFLVDEEDQPL